MSLLSLSKSQFLEKAKEYNLISLHHTVFLDMETPVSIFIKSGAYSKKNTFLLESVVKGNTRGQYSIIGLDNRFLVSGKYSHYVKKDLQTSISVPLKSSLPIEALQESLNGYKPYLDLPFSTFSSGAVGFFSYDCIRYYENISGVSSSSLEPQLQSKQEDPLELDDLYYVFPNMTIIFDHTSARISIVCNIFLKDNKSSLEKQYLDVEKKVYILLNNIKTNHYLEEYNKLERPDLSDSKIKDIIDLKNWKSFTTKKDFYKMVKTSKEYIKNGDVFQVVPSIRFFNDYTYDSFFLYRSLRCTNPSPYMFYLNFDNMQVIGSSPEILVKIEDTKVTLRPIAGTIHRGKSISEDNELSEKLLNDPKEKAEHIMLVDLGRNDLGKISKYGTVNVEDFMIIEKYSHVMHIVSNIVSELKEGLTSFDALRSTFPAGTMTGAPKIRAMEIIEEIEKEKRGLYSGTIGFFDFNGNLNSCIVLRTIIVKNNVMYVQAGVGIVDDSIPEKEEQEVYNKCLSSLKAIQLVYEKSW